MQCPQCKKEGGKSNVYPGSSSTTLMGSTPYYDEEGIYHNHDHNWSTTKYTCSIGHTWNVSHRTGCPADKCEHKYLEKVSLEE